MTKDSFFLRKTHNDRRFLAIALLVFYAILFLFTLLYEGFKIGMLYLTLFGAYIVFYTFIDYKITGIYISKNEVVRKSVFSKRAIDINSVICIKILPDTERSFSGSIVDLKDENGNILFLMHFLSRCYEQDEMDGYEIIEAIKGLFIEKHLACCIYDKEALDYLLTLNPNIKVVYYDEK